MLLTVYLAYFTSLCLLGRMTWTYENLFRLCKKWNMSFIIYLPVFHYFYHQFLKNYFCGVIQRSDFTLHSPLEKFNEIGNDSPSQELDFKKNTIDSELHSLKISSKLLVYLTSNLQHLVDKWHQTCAQLEDILTVGLILLCPINPKKELQDSHHSHPYVFHFNLRYVLTHGRCKLKLLLFVFCFMNQFFHYPIWYAVVIVNL